MTDAAPPRRPLLRRALPWLLGLATFAALAFACVSRTYPPLPRELTLELKFPAGLAGRTEPLIASGIFGEADFITVNYLGPTTATFSYDYWGFGGPTSAPVTFEPGSRHTLRLALPAFTALRGEPASATAPLRLAFDGRVILQQDVPFHPRDPDRIFFGENPVGGSTAGGVFHGEIFTADHRPARGSLAVFFSPAARLTNWLSARPGEAFALALLALTLAALTDWLLTRVSAPRIPRSPPPARPPAPHAWFLGTTALCAAAFSFILTGGTFHFIFPESFGNFYDHQAVSLLHGRLDLPPAVLGSESFVFAGKSYGYFGPTPALLRLPFTILEVGFGQLSRSFLLAYYLASLAAVYALLIQASRLLRGPLAWPARTDVVLLVASAGLGTTLFYVSSRAYIYHEAILCGVAFALWSGWCTLRWLAAPERRGWLGALVCGTLSVHARPPVGLFALSFLGCAAAAHLWQRRSAGPRAWSRPLAIGALSVLGVLSFNALSYLKFKSFDGAPLKYHIQYHPARLAAIDGKNFHAANFRYNFDSYIWRPNFHLRPAFPWFFADGRNPLEYPGAKIDVAETTLALPYGMSAIFFLAVAGGGFALVRWPAARPPLSLLLVAALPMSAALFMAIAISQRYTADFCPALLIAAAFGLTAATLLPRGLRRAARTTVALLALWSVFVTAAITLHFQNEIVWGVPDDVKARYHSLRQTADAFFGFTPHDR